jgi:hypothetical protein
VKASGRSTHKALNIRSSEREPLKRFSEEIFCYSNLAPDFLIGARRSIPVLM